MKRVFLLAAISAAAFGSAAFAVACIGDEPGPLPNTPDNDADQPDTFRPDSGDPDAGQPLPKTLPELALWLDADDSASVVRNGSNDVTKWTDKSGKGRDFLKTQASNAPRFAPQAMNKNTRNALLFTQSAQQTLTGPKFDGFSNVEAFMVFQTIDSKADAAYGLSIFGPYGSQHPAATGLTVEALGSTSFPLSTNEIPAANFYDPQIFGVISKPGKYFAYWNGKVLTTSNDNAVGFSTAGSLIGGTNVNTNTLNPTAWFNGYVAEFIIYARQLTEQEHEAIQSYLSTKWGIPRWDGG